MVFAFHGSVYAHFGDSVGFPLLSAPYLPAQCLNSIRFGLVTLRPHLGHHLLARPRLLAFSSRDADHHRKWR